MGVLSEGIHSFLDLISAAVAFYTVREAGKPADHDHPYGHGKIETLSSLFESILLVAAAGLIVYESGDRVLNPAPIHHEALAIGTIVVSLVVSYAMFLHNREAATETESSALHVNALHFLSDVVASVGVIAGLLLMKLTGWQVIDPIMGFAVAAYILAISARQIRSALMELSDTQLPEHEIRTIRGILDRFKGRSIEAHDLRTRRSGPVRHVDFHLVVCGKTTVEESHSICDEMEASILDVYPRASVNIHVEPCEHLRAGCEKTCAFYKKVRS